MGVEVGAARLLCLASRAGVDFSRTLTLGRQSLHVNRADLERAMTECGVPFKPEFLQSDGYADSLFRALGAKDLQAMDASDYEGAHLVHDLNQPLPADLRERYSLVFDGGTLEHVFNFPAAIANAMNLVEVGGDLVSVTVCNNFVGHGFYQFSPELFFRVFSPENGYRIRGIFVFEVKDSGLDDAVAYRVTDPATLGRRVLLRNANETLIAAWAKRISAVPIFSNPVQQSDYLENWSAGEGNATAQSGSSLKERTRPIRYAMKRRWRSLTSGIPIRGNDRYDAEAFAQVRFDESLLPSLQSSL